MSTISTCGADEDHLTEQPARLGAYAASKWVSETHVHQMLSAGNINECLLASSSARVRVRAVWCHWVAPKSNYITVAVYTVYFIHIVTF